ncbi:MAG TPA: protein-L-isoaspartate(D-aspartate) O-methyltransferase [Polyangia bacterium]|nr:protein-L-isoaspartate(D-aspartate) O-methyltransferase [Polyangia bacterium]
MIECHPHHARPAAQRMVDEQVRARGISDKRVLAAMASLPRHIFVPAPVRGQAYEDHAVPIGFDVTISQPFVVAWMTAALELDGDGRVLEVGTGSGYQAAVLGRLAREVYSIERVPVLARRARFTLHALGLDNVHVVVGDGSIGLAEHAPYDGILVTAAAPSVPDELLAQLACGGRLVVPVGGPALQSLRVIRRDDEGRLSSSDRGGVVFVPLVGERGYRAS